MVISSTALETTNAGDKRVKYEEIYLCEQKIPMDKQTVDRGGKTCVSGALR